MSITVFEIGKAILQSEYEYLLPDGMALSLPTPALLQGEKCIGAFVYSLREGRCRPPRGAFCLQYPELRVLSYRRETLESLGERQLPALAPAELEEAAGALESALGPLMEFFPQPPPTREAAESLRRYDRALRRLAGDAAAYYRAVFPYYFNYVSMLG